MNSMILILIKFINPMIFLIQALDDAGGLLSSPRGYSEQLVGGAPTSQNGAAAPTAIRSMDPKMKCFKLLCFMMFYNVLLRFISGDPWSERCRVWHSTKRYMDGVTMGSVQAFSNMAGVVAIAWIPGGPGASARLPSTS